MYFCQWNYSMKLKGTENIFPFNSVNKGRVNSLQIQHLF